MPNKHRSYASKSGIYSGITSASGILENQAANTQFHATANKSNSQHLGKTAGWTFAGNYPNSAYCYGLKDFQSEGLIALFDNEGNVITKADAEKMGSSLARERTIGISMKKINDSLSSSSHTS